MDPIIIKTIIGCIAFAIAGPVVGCLLSALQLVDDLVGGRDSLRLQLRARGVGVGRGCGRLRKRDADAECEQQGQHGRCNTTCDIAVLDCCFHVLRSIRYADILP